MNDNSLKIIEVDMNDILPNRFQPRIQFDESEILELSDSIKEHGVIQPIVVRKIGDKYEIIAGERRYKASVLAGKETVPVIIKNLNDKDSAEIALIENVQRKNLTPIEEALSYKKILDMGYMTQEDLAAKIGKSQSSVANKIRLLNLSDEVQEALLENKISERHARSLLRLSTEQLQNDMLHKITKERLTVRKTDEEIDKIKNNNMQPLDENKKEEKNMNNNIVPDLNLQNNLNSNILNNENNQNQSTEFFNSNQQISQNPINNIINQPTNLQQDSNVFNLNTMNTTSMMNQPQVPPMMEQQIPSMEPSQMIQSVDSMMNQPQVPPMMEQQIPSMEQPQIIQTVDPMMSQSQIPQRDSNVFNLNSTSLPVENNIEIPQTAPIMEPSQINEPPKPASFDIFADNAQGKDMFSFGPSVDNIIEKEPQNIQPQVAQQEYKNPEPIIITDYSKQYDPIMPTDLNNSTPNIDFKEVISLIRECSNKIEQYGFKIDVEEYDLANMYEAVFKIEKK